jgi:hypothetical protein
MKFAKVKTTDFRHKAQASPGLSQWDRTEAAMAREHDNAVRTYGRDAARAALADIAHRSGSSKDPEYRWIRHRRAALQRKLYAPELCRK